MRISRAFMVLFGATVSLGALAGLVADASGGEAVVGGVVAVLLWGAAAVSGWWWAQRVKVINARHAAREDEAGADQRIKARQSLGLWGGVVGVSIGTAVASSLSQVPFAVLFFVLVAAFFTGGLAATVRDSGRTDSFTWGRRFFGGRM